MAVIDSQASRAVLSSQIRISERPRRPTARASAAGMLRQEPTRARLNNLSATPLAGHTYRQVYSTQSHDTSARPFRPRRDRWSAACAGWAAHGGLQAFLIKTRFTHRDVVAAAWPPQASFRLTAAGDMYHRLL